jgi:RNA polymerase sigma factor (sigma-70 family)
LAGNEAAVVEFEERVRCVPRILSALNGRRGRPLDEHDLADLVGDTVLIVLRKLDEFEARGPLEGWIYRLCYLEFLNAVRRRGRERRRTEEWVDDAAGDSGSTHHTHDDVHHCLEQLGGVEAEAIRSKHFDMLTFEEIGERLALPANTVKTRYYRGLARLADKLRTHQRREERT